MNRSKSPAESFVIFRSFLYALKRSFAILRRFAKYRIELCPFWLGETMKDYEK